MGVIGLGRIFWAVYPGSRGGGKLRPMIAVSSDADIRQNKATVAVVCSTDFDKPLEPFEVQLPFSPDGRCRTKLRKPTVAVCDWTTVFRVDDIEEYGGWLEQSVVLEILAKANLNQTKDVQPGHESS